MNKTAAQRQRLLAALRTAPVSTITARRDLDIMMPAARIHELKHRFGHNISKVMVKEQTNGELHNNALYVLLPTVEATP